LDGIAGIDEQQVAWRNGADVRAIEATLVTGDYFRGLRVTATRGRLLTAGGSERPGAGLRHRVWRQNPGGRKQARGRQPGVERTAYTIVGIADAGFSGTSAMPVDVWLPLEFTTRVRGDGASLAERDSSWLQPIARLAEDATLRQALTEAQVVAARFDANRPE